MANDDNQTRTAQTVRNDRKVETKEEKIIQNGLTGLAGQESEELIPSFLVLPNERTISNGDSYIVLGRDREHIATSGHGGMEGSRAFSVDIVVGRKSGDKETMDELAKIRRDGGDRSIFVDPDFRNDAARIYISQNSDLDKYFHLTSSVGLGTVGNVENQSGIGLCADSIRILARDGIKLVAHSDEKDSKAFRIPKRKGIDLISLPYDDKDPNKIVSYKDTMQPIPKGYNLREALRSVVTQLDTLSGLFITFVKTQNAYNNAVANHTHHSPFKALTINTPLNMIVPNIDQNISIFAETTIETMEYKMAYLNKFITNFLEPSSHNYINSRFHHLN